MSARYVKKHSHAIDAVAVSHQSRIKDAAMSGSN